MTEISPAVQAFLDQTEVHQILNDLKDFFREKPMEVSDVKDAAGNQYVDLVQEGGGVWGIALVGYTYVLEQMGIRFFSLAGTSAGSINAMLLACCGKKEEAKSTIIMDELLKLNLFNLVDGKKTNWAFTKIAKTAIQRIVLRKHFIQHLTIITKIFCVLEIVACLVALLGHFIAHRVYFMKWVGLGAGIGLLGGIAISIYLYHLFAKFNKSGYGINEGNFFLRWICDTISSYLPRASDTGKAEPNMHDFKLHFSEIPSTLIVTPDSRRKDNSVPSTPTLSIIASDITAERKIEFPRMWDLYWKRLEDIHPGYFVRASMSIPIFFETYTVKNIKAHSSLKTWQDRLDWKGTELPDTEQFVDGGILSNFPISVFANPVNPVPRTPTFGIRLTDSLPDQTKNANTTLAGYIGSIVGTMRYNYDRDFISKNKAFELGVKEVMLEGHNWLNFFMTIEEKYAIFNCGARAAKEFLKQFNWADYKEARLANWVSQQTPDPNPNNL